MARIDDEFMCPSCHKKSKLCVFKYGVISSTLCTFCLEVYLHDTLNPFVKNELELKLHVKDSEDVK